MTPTTLTAHRDRIIAERGWTDDLAKILDPGCYTHSDHRAVLAWELRQSGYGWTWPEIAEYLGYACDRTALAAASHRDAAEARFKLARDSKRAEKYRMTP